MGRGAFERVLQNSAQETALALLPIDQWVEMLPLSVSCATRGRVRSFSASPSPGHGSGQFRRSPSLRCAKTVLLKLYKYVG